jgi:hypothetical protein
MLSAQGNDSFPEQIVTPWKIRASVLDLYDPYGQGIVLGMGRRLDEKKSLTLDVGALVLDNTRFPTTGWKVRLGLQFYQFEQSGTALIFHGPEVGWKHRMQVRGEFADRQGGLYREYVTYLQKGHDFLLHYQLGTSLFPENQRFGVEVSIGLGARTFRHLIDDLPLDIQLGDPGFPLGINPRENWVVLPSAGVRMLLFLSPWLNH